MLDAAERLKDEDATALSGMLVAVPMAIVTIKMMVDMVLLILSLMAVVGAFLINSVMAFYLEEFYTQMSRCLTRARTRP